MYICKYGSKLSNGKASDETWIHETSCRGSVLADVAAKVEN